MYVGVPFQTSSLFALPSIRAIEEVEGEHCANNIALFDFALRSFKQVDSKPTQNNNNNIYTSNLFNHIHTYHIISVLADI